MPHHQTKFLTEGARLDRVLERLPKDWRITIERDETMFWSVVLADPEGSCVSETGASLGEALETAWRALRRPPSESGR
ncbi:hypothetical protein D5366_05140 [Neokomagataea tanensis]|uniref:DUF1902 domain-containing protein n=1 Tax=Neokomagataea tanensis TaxID=661191 RepID=A0A4Y6V5S1_9PROT|nr:MULTISPECIES: hypothetical protein [Neokomagataea]QDH24714.1 hypothetical protein D5366_05140 [Neokomagataea tanensis]